MIPKKIHYCWFGSKPFPELIKKCIKTWEKNLSDYEFYLWNEDNSPMSIPFVKEAYAARKYAFVADYIRFWALYQHGGIYLDTDMFVVRSFNSLLDNNCFFAWETADDNVIGCCAIGCIQNHNFIDAILTYYNNLNFTVESINDFVVPRLITPIYNIFQNKEDVRIFPYTYFYPFPYKERNKPDSFQKYITKDTYAIHLWNLSWVSNYDKLIRRIVSFIKNIFK